MVSTPRPNRPIFATTKKKSDVQKTNRTKVNTYAKEITTPLGPGGTFPRSARTEFGGMSPSRRTQLPNHSAI